MKVDGGSQAKPDVAREFESQFFDMRQALAQHQAKWRSSQHRRGQRRLPPPPTELTGQAGRILHLGEERATGL